MRRIAKALAAAGAAVALSSRGAAADFVVGGSGFAPVFTGSATDAIKYTCMTSSLNAGETGVPEWMDCDSNSTGSECAMSMSFWVKPVRQGRAALARGLYFVAQVG